MIFGMRKLSAHQRQLYSLMRLMVLCGLLVGIVWVALGFNSEAEDQEADWLTTSVPALADTAHLQQLIAQNPRWFRDVSAKNTDASGMVAAGSPEGFRVVGVVTKGSERYAVFMLQANIANAKASPVLVQRKEGERLVGDWIITRIASSDIEVQQGEVSKTLKVYDAVPTVKEQPKSRRAR